MTQQLIEAQEEAQQTESFAFSLGLTPSRTKERFENQQSSIGQVGRASSSAAFSLAGPKGNKSVWSNAGNIPLQQNSVTRSGRSLYGKQSNGTNGKTSSPVMSHTHSRFHPGSNRALLSDLVQIKAEPGGSGGAGFGEGAEDGSLWRSPRVNKGNTHKYEDFTVPVSRSNGYIDGRKSPLLSNKKRRVDDTTVC